MTRKRHKIWIWFEGSFKGFRMQIEIFAALLIEFPSNNYICNCFCQINIDQSWGLTNLPGNNRKVMSEQWPGDKGARFPIQGSCVQNHWVAPRSTQSFILLRWTKWVPGISGNFVVKSKLPLEVALALR